MGSHDSQFLTQFNSYFMLSRIRIGICIQIQANDCKSILSVKRDRRFVAGLRFQNEHSRAGSLCRLLQRFQQHRPDALSARGALEDADVAETEAAVPALG